MVARASQFTKHTGFVSESPHIDKPSSAASVFQYDFFHLPFASHTVNGAPVLRVGTGAQRKIDINSRRRTPCPNRESTASSWVRSPQFRQSLGRSHGPSGRDSRRDSRHPFHHHPFPRRLRKLRSG